MAYTDKNKLRVVYGDYTLGVHGDGFDYIFSYSQGGIESIVKKGYEWLYRCPKPTFWRALTDNDRGSRFHIKSGSWLASDMFIDCKKTEVIMDGELQKQYAPDTQDAKMKGFSQSRFSFNVKGGRCEACQGDGIIKIEMHFLSDVYVPCEVCKGKRYNRETLEVKYKGKSINDVLEMTAEEGMEFFANIPRIYRKLKTLCDVGLGYIKIGQPATTLSGGEAQRVKLATELAKRPTGKTVYILDEPTTGLHIADVHRLIDVLQQLVDTGNTVVVIEHNLDLIKTADHIIDLGPEGGDMGGTVIAEGTPEEVAKNENSFTGQYLKPFLNMN